MSRPSLYRPLLIPGLARLWRDQHTLQLGLDSRRAIVLELSGTAGGELLDLVDGTRSEGSILDRARRIGVAEDEARGLLGALRAAGLLLGAHHFLPSRLPAATRQRLEGEAAAIALGDSAAVDNPAQVLRRRYAAAITITGPGPAAGPIAVALAQAGIGRIYPDLLGPATRSDAAGGAATGAGPRAKVVAAGIRRVAPDVRTGPVLPRTRADLVVQLGLDRPATLLATAFAQRRQPHLLVTAREGTMIVGPLVPRDGIPCLRCLDLHRRDRDPAWPVLAAQLVPRAGAEPPAGSAATVLAAAAYAAAEILAHLDGDEPKTVGAAVEIDGPARVRRRAWGQHPECDCGRRHRRAPVGFQIPQSQ